MYNKIEKQISSHSKYTHITIKHWIARSEQTDEFLFAFFNDVLYSYVIIIGLLKVVNRMSYQLPLTAKTFCLLALSNPMFNCYVYTLAMVTDLFLDFIVHFDNLSLLKMVRWKVPPKY